MTSLKVNQNKVGAHLRRTRRHLQRSEKLLQVTIQSFREAAQSIIALKNEIRHLESTHIYIQKQIFNILETTRLEESLNDDLIVDDEVLQATDHLLIMQETGALTTTGTMIVWLQDCRYACQLYLATFN